MIKVIKNGTVITMNNNDNRISKYDIVIKDNIIIDVCENYNGEYDELIDAKGKIVMPGLINCHTHLGMSIFRATNDNLDLNSWLNNKIWPIESKMTSDDVYHTTLLSTIEMIKTGTTMSNDMYFHKEGALKAIKESKVRNMFPLYFIGEYKKEEFDELEKFYLSNKDNELLSFAVSPHSFYTCTKELMQNCKLLADKYDLPIHTHFCENESEVKTIETKYNMKPVEVLNDLGYLDNKLLLAHSTFISDSELELLKDKKVSLIHNPVSNLNLGCGIADIVKYLRHNLNICLGTDGVGSGNNMNLFYHMSFVDFLQKGKYQNPEIFESYETLKMATINGAKALGLEDKIGSIEVGKYADIIILDISNIETYPALDLIVEVVHNIESRNIDTTIINGEVLMQNHKIKHIDEEFLKGKIDEIIERIG